MGQEHSATKDSSALLSITKSFTSKNVKSAAGSIVIVKSSQEEKLEINQDEDMRILQSIPVFYPILRNSLNLPGIKDPADVTTKIDHRPVLCVLQKLQEHLTSSSEMICSEQAGLGSRVREIDYAVATLLNGLYERQKQFVRLQSELSKIQEINSHLTKITANLQEIVPMAKAINKMLPEQDRLPTFDLGHLHSASNDQTGICSAIDLIEQTVIDEGTTKNM